MTKSSDTDRFLISTGVGIAWDFSKSHGQGVFSAISDDRHKIMSSARLDTRLASHLALSISRVEDDTLRLRLAKVQLALSSVKSGRVRSRFAGPVRQRMIVRLQVELAALNKEAEKRQDLAQLTHPAIRKANAVAR
jgi:hypothetical protein